VTEIVSEYGVALKAGAWKLRLVGVDEITATAVSVTSAIQGASPWPVALLHHDRSLIGSNGELRRIYGTESVPAVLEAESQDWPEVVVAVAGASARPGRLTETVRAAGSVEAPSASQTPATRRQHRRMQKRIDVNGADVVRQTGSFHCGTAKTHRTTRTGRLR